MTRAGAHDIAARLRRLHGAARRGEWILAWTGAAAWSYLIATLWLIVDRDAQVEALALGALTLIAATWNIRIFSRKRPQGLTDGQWSLYLEMRTARPRTGEPRPGSPAVAAELERELFREARRGLLGRLLGLSLPAALLAVALPLSSASLTHALRRVSGAVALLASGARLEIVQGGTDAKIAGQLKLSANQPLDLELLPQNLLRLTYVSVHRTAPSVELRRPGEPQSQDSTLLQSFQMLPVAAQSSVSEHQELQTFALTFAVDQDCELALPHFAGTKPLARLKVRQLPVPKVTLRRSSGGEDPWPDDQPLLLHIDVDAVHPLDTVRLLIRSGTRKASELVANVLAQDLKSVSTDYRLILEHYVENDLDEVEIRAEATDRAVPTPLVGVSPPLRVSTASAYGRYRQTLATLRELKSMTDEVLAKAEPSGRLPAEAAALAAKAVDQSERSPYFDGLDRAQVHNFASRALELSQSGRSNRPGGPRPAGERLLDFSQLLDAFLVEHEILDDRERDRDFFVAARALSRLVSEPPAKRAMPLTAVTTRVRQFLDEREQRWQRRIGHLPEELRPPRWTEVQQQRPFHSALAAVERLDGQAESQPKARSDQVTALAKAVTDYRAFIDDLEAREDRAREQAEQDHKKNLASAQEALRELQKRQGEVSSELDRAAERPKTDLEAAWPGTRLKENANLRDTRRMENQLRSLSATAAARIQGAAAAMEQAVAAGNAGAFDQAESAADLAGRLLRQAESAAQQSREQRRSRGRRRQVSGDNYFGQSVVGGDLEIRRGYEVDRRYREDVLREVEAQPLDDEQRLILDRYLRQVIR